MAGVTDAQLEARDRANRGSIFNPDVDPVWAQVDRLLGVEVSAEIQASLIDEGELM